MSCRCMVAEGKGIVERVMAYHELLAERKTLIQKAEVAFEAIYQRFWQRIAKERMANLSIEGNYDPTAEFEQELIEAMQEYSSAAFTLGTADARRMLVRENMAGRYNAPALAVLEREPERFAELFGSKMVATVKDTIMDVLHQGLTEGWTIRRMQEVLKEKREVALGRSEMIARTVVGKSHNIGVMRTFEASDLTQAVLTGCDPSCPECGPYLGKPYPLSEAIAIEQELHPNHTGAWIPDSSEIDSKIQELL